MADRVVALPADSGSRGAEKAVHVIAQANTASPGPREFALATYPF